MESVIASSFQPPPLKKFPVFFPSGVDVACGVNAVASWPPTPPRLKVPLSPTIYLTNLLKDVLAAVIHGSTTLLSYLQILQTPIERTSSGWSMSDLCACVQSWANHDILEDSIPADTAPAITTSAIPPPLLPPPPLRLLQPTLPNPITAFTGPTWLLSTSANDTRNLSRACNFPHKYKPPRTFPATAVTTNFKAEVLLWPNVNPGEYEPPGGPTLDFKYTSDQFAETLIHLKSYNLVFIVTLPVADRDSTITQDLTSQLSAHLHTHNLVLPPPPFELPANEVLFWFRQHWVLMAPRQQGGIFTFEPHANANTNNFNHKMILQMNEKFFNPDIENHDKPLIVLAPRFGHVHGALVNLPTGADEDIDEPQLPHQCFGQRILYGLPHSGRLRELRPYSLPRSTRNVSVHLKLWSHPGATFALDPPPSHWFVPIWADQDFIAISFDDDTDSDLPLAPRMLRRAPNPVRASTIHQPAPIRLATGPEIATWQHKVAMDVRTIGDSDYVDVQGSSVTAIAEFLLDVLYFLAHKRVQPALPFPSSDTIRSPRVGITHYALLQPSLYREYRIGGPGVATSLGRGIEHAVFRTVLSLISEQYNFWVSSQAEPTFSTFSLYPLPGITEERKSRFYSHGRAIALHLFYYGHGLSVGLWPILAIVLGRDSMLLGENFLREISPSIAAQFKPWFALAPADPIPTSLSDPVCGLIMDMSLTPSMISSPRTKQQHDDWTVTLLSHALLAHDNPWQHPEFLALSDGFNMPLNGLSNMFTFNHQFHDLSPLRAACLIAGMFHRQVQSIENEIVPHLQFAVLGLLTATPEVAILCDLFKLRLIRYLQGTGHPQWLRTHGLIATDQEMQRGQANQFLRAHLLLLTALESSLLPISESWLIKTNAPTEALPLQFHTCTGGVNVRINPKLYVLLIESPVLGEDMEFDVWVHTQLYNADLAYTRI
ncbi:hypothetical protein C8J57DRAFT_1256371 [Mycena rebaudengoi]|nr:hypothetical protein C8J57DRAFT_1256371 [Mycena rebaudengoi]